MNIYKKVINIYKPIGATPLQVVEKFKKENPEYKDKKIAYAGRLDPMAHGVLILLIEPETKKRKKYQNLDKEYEFEILFGVSTDTYDILGIPDLEGSDPARCEKINLGEEINKYIPSLIGEMKQKYPPFSSKTVKGKPLFWWARENKLDEIVIPKKEVNIYSLSLVKSREITKNKLSKLITQRIKKVSGDFRQEKILKSWEQLFKKYDISIYHTFEFRISCSSGTYVRSIANEMGEKMGVGVIALEILRTKVGKYKLEDSIRLP